MLIRKFWSHRMLHLPQGAFQSFLFWMLIRKLCVALTGAMNAAVSILLILDVDSEVSRSLLISSENEKFQSFLFWMLIRKTTDWGHNWRRRRSFNPSYSGCWFGRNIHICTIQSHKKVSILLILDVDSEGGIFCRKRFYISSFNPSYSGCWFGRCAGLQQGFTARRFQSFLFWMLIRKNFDASFTVVVGVGFNPSYSGCWFGSTYCLPDFIELNLFQSFLFWMLIRKDRSTRGHRGSIGQFQSFLFWMLIRKQAQ